MLLFVCFLPLFFPVTLVRAVPAVAPSPSPALLNTAQLNESTSANLSYAESDLQLTPFVTNTTPANPSASDVYRIPGTHTFLRLAISDEPIVKANLGRTILQTQKQLRDFITAYRAYDMLLNRLEDPFESSEEWTGCFFGVTSYPMDQDFHLTYGMIADSLQGMWNYMYRGDRLIGAVFEVNDDTWGVVGVGKISVSRPAPSALPVMRGSGNGSIKEATLLDRASAPQLTSRSTNTVEETAPITFYRVPGTPTVIRPPRSSPKKT
ncbi:hypothetical protein ABVK25_006830 [Lepraria finkii]|uniref:Uncharacterized protein n=1 Tax=Lepraria finkii TaxID=1340010 RepID=A0ABR4B5K9_9LECA